MKVNTFFITLLSVFSFLLVTAQSAPDTINQTDNKGRKQGVWKKTHPQNTVYQYVGQFKDDKPYGVFKYYYIDGALKSIVKFSNSGILARSISFWENGRVMSKGNYIKQEKDSTWIYYDQYGYLNMVEQYSQGKLNGWRVTYYRLARGEKESPVLEQAYFKDGKMDGEWKKFYRNGNLEVKGKFENGKRTGIFEYFHPNEKRKLTENYKNGKKHGYIVYFDESGEVLKRDFYWEGNPLKGEMRKKFEKIYQENKK